MRRAAALALAVGVVAMPATMATAAHVPTKAEQKKIEAAIKKHMHGVPKGLHHMASDINAKWGAFNWSKFVPNEMAETGLLATESIPAVGMGYMHKYAGKWIVVAHHGSSAKERKAGCKMIPAAVRKELAAGLKVKDVCRK